MLLNIVILILQEIIEASMIIALLLVLLIILRLSIKSIISGIALGILGAIIYGYNVSAISSLFEYTGQEITYAGLQLLVAVLLAVISLCFSIQVRNKKAHVLLPVLIQIFIFGVVMLAIIREGSEIYIYLVGVISQQEPIINILMGSCLGAGIGVCTAILLFYLLINLEHQILIFVLFVLLAMVAGSMASQALVLLNQAGYIAASAVLWDSNFLIEESSVLGRMLYSFIGYEATPSLYQLSAYACAAIVVLLPFFGFVFFRYDHKIN